MLMTEPDYYNKIMDDMNKLMNDSFSTGIDSDEFNEYLYDTLTGENIDNATPYEFAVNVIAHTAGRNLIHNNTLDKEIITEYDNEITVACMQVLLSTFRDYTSCDEFVFSGSLLYSIYDPLNYYDSMNFSTYNIVHNVFSMNNLTINSVYRMSKKLMQAFILIITMIILNNNDNILSYLYSDSVNDAAAVIDIFHHTVIDNILIGNTEEFAIESFKAMIEN